MPTRFMPASPVPLPSLPESYRTVSVPDARHWLRRLFAFLGPGYLVAVGYIDPGNWATDLAGGSGYGYSLLWAICLSNLMALLLQSLSARLGIATGRDLAQACREHYSAASAMAQWILCELAICAADLAEVLGTAIALKLLFGLPLVLGVALTSFDVLVLMAVHRRGFRYLEALVVALLAVAFFCFAVNLHLANPDWAAVAAGFVPDRAVLSDRKMLYLSLGILGATVMPHNLYLHSSIVQTRRYLQDMPGKKAAIRFAGIDLGIALTFALVVNAAILITAGAVFHEAGHPEVVEIESAHRMLTPLLGSLASVLFGVALLACGQSSTITATLAGQIVMEGFTRFKLSPWLRRLVTRSLALLPALAVISLGGEKAVTKLMVLSQVVLNLQLPFAIGPLVLFTSDPKRMGAFVNPRWITGLAYCILGAIIFLNVKLVLDFLGAGTL